MKDKTWLFILTSILFCLITFSINHEVAQQKKLVTLGKLILWQDDVINEMYSKMDNYTDLILRYYVDRESN